MSKLQKKIFWTLFVILSLFLLTILCIFNYQNYHREKVSIEQNLSRVNNFGWKNPLEKEKIPKSLDDNKMDEFIEEERHRRFIDATIYTVLLDNNGKITEIISHTEDGLVADKIKEESLKIINDVKENKIYIGNLYFNDYAYKYELNNYITLIDTKDISKRLKSSFLMAAILFLLGETVIVVLSKILSIWIIRPVEISFNKQKQFVADASHELKTPLSVIMACAETLENNPKDNKWLNTIKCESERMSKLITNLLDLAKVENEDKQDLYELINLSKLVEKAILTFESLAYEKDIKLDYEITDDISFRCNGEQIGELLNIMLDNAIKHSLKKGHIIVNLRKEKGNTVLEVINKGKPIPKGEEEKIFERFYRGDKSRNRDDNRYGLGLSIAASIVANHKGKISAVSDAEYTTFKVIFSGENIK